jgi:hypothetical protein
MTDIRAAIVMISRTDGKLRLTDGSGREHAIDSDQDLRDTINRILDDPEIPQVEQVARLETAAEHIITNATATLLPETVKSLAGPLVRDLIAGVRHMAQASAERRSQRTASTPPPNPPPETKERARANRRAKSQFRIGTTVKRRGNAA